jgi:hypothetical protein
MTSKMFENLTADGSGMQLNTESKHTVCWVEQAADFNRERLRLGRKLNGTSEMLLLS